MKVLIDENIPFMTAQALRDLGRDVLDIRGTSEQGMTDKSLWELAQGQGRLLITTDKGFAQRRDESHHGILIIRLRQPNRQRIHRRVMRAMAQFQPEEWPGMLVVVRDKVQSVWRVSGANLP
jgi:predicted nuclease of predicted toxin-antitoxin system